MAFASGRQSGSTAIKRATTDAGYSLVPVMREDVSDTRIAHTLGLLAESAAMDEGIRPHFPICEITRIGSTLAPECETCYSRALTTFTTLCAPFAQIWEVWGTVGDERLQIGVLALVDVKFGVSARIVWAFCDGDLSDKMDLFKEVADFAFRPSGRWAPLRYLRIRLRDEDMDSPLVNLFDMGFVFEGEVTTFATNGVALLERTDAVLLLRSDRHDEYLNGDRADELVAAVNATSVSAAVAALPEQFGEIRYREA